ncbi:hypothetical protein E2P84_31235 [Burkholderia cepacia]|uniref:Tyr recombinase domain-containing protein n=1 Tax=Burkholderia cepacia TaxID=292 RepID=A0AAX2RFQ7_BURCE|nr:tyrosine-type recombinase/integrase [Burkholderia cepacia]TES70163.1 hypothetical protein E2P84_31235 [Burkholderia cepacia]TES97464.1 hypothetical protein E3D36_32455 [Burkholderia cepacia]TEU35293.1 hypothetical protein E3D37_37795 [Burkholderia cepacia]TEU40421.1 hypothetical protein E3D38_34650 [Burkholderia cepacia]TEU86562.1 hypothetical protein E3D40_40495 [Burkholderia cepacia]
MNQQGLYAGNRTGGDGCGKSVRAPSRAEWQGDPEKAFKGWVVEVATSKGNRPYSERSQRQYAAMFHRFVTFLKTCGSSVLSAGPDVIEAYLASLEGRNPYEPGCAGSAPPASSRPATRSTLKRHSDLIDDVMNHLVVQGYRTENPVFAGTRRLPGRDTGPQLVCLPDQVDARLQDYLLNVMDTSSWAGRRNRALLLLLSGSGITSGQASNARLSQFIFDDAVPSFECVPQNNVDHYRAPLAQSSVAAIREWVEERQLGGGPSGADPEVAFPGKGGGALSTTRVYLEVRKVLQAIEFHGNDMGPRVLRNTYARRQLLNGASVDVVARLLGIENPRNILRLLRITPAHTGYVPV